MLRANLSHALCSFFSLGNNRERVKVKAKARAKERFVISLRQVVIADQPFLTSFYSLDQQGKGGYYFYEYVDDDGY
jgi:hypothetical protein